MEYTPYVRQLRGKDLGEERARTMAIFEEMVQKLDLKKILLEMTRDKFGMVL